MNKNIFKKILEEYYADSPPVRYTLAVDFDGTLCYSSYPEAGEEIEEVCSFIRSISHLDCNLILYTCRQESSLDLAIEWCFNHGIYFDYVNENPEDRIIYYGNCNKLSYDMLIDDKAFGFDIKNFS